MSNEWISVACPHCNCMMSIEHKFISYSLFRHTLYKKNNRPVSPDMDQKTHDELIKRKQVVGCYKPFFLYKQDDGNVTTIKCTFM